MSRTVDGRFLDSVDRYPARTFLRHLTALHDLRVSYLEAAGRTAATVDSLVQRGLRPGERVVCYLDEIVPSIFFCLAATHVGIWPVPIAPGFSADAVAELVEQVGASAVFTTPELAPKLVARGIRPLCFVEPGARVPGVEPLDCVCPPDRASAVRRLREAESRHTGDDVYMLLPTSGTTGRSKLAMIPHRHMTYCADLMSFGARHDDDPSHRLLAVAALTHGMGQILLSVGLTIAAEFCVPGGLDTITALAEVRALDPTYLTLTPRVLRSLHAQHVARHGESPSPLFGPAAQLLVVGGGATDVGLMRKVNDQGVDVIECLGGTEYGFAAAGPRGDWRPGLVGKQIPDVKLRYDDDGELLVWSPEHMIGYYQDEKATAAAFTADGYYHTGDYCETTADGYLRYAGRKKDVFNTHEGSNVHPVRIENEIELLPWVRQVVLVGDQRPFLCALIVVRDEITPLPDGDGHLDEEVHAALYARAHNDLSRINRDLKPIEWVRRFSLFARPMAAELYAIVGHSKTRRNRPAIGKAYAARIAGLYAEAPTAADVSRFHGDLMGAMEFVDGMSLHSLLSACAPLPAAAVAYIGLEIARALVNLHQRRGEDGAPLGLVYGDVSPPNVLISYACEVTLADLGVERAHSRSANGARGPQGGFAGKIPYAAPEQLRKEALDARTDLYGLGLTMHEALTGRRVFVGEDASALTAGVPRLGDDVPYHLAELVMHLVECEPGKRPLDAAWVCDRLRELAHPAAPTTDGERELLEALLAAKARAAR
jgi:long-subunit acyl-CoA synthetase (AMP-forming)